MSERSHEICPQCNEPSPFGGRFCANCGTPLDPASGQIRALIDEALKTRFKDQQYLAVETSVAAAEKLTSWLKLFLYWAAIPLFLIAVLLGILGFRTYGDFTSKVERAELQVESTSAAAQRTAESARQEASNAVANLQVIEANMSGLQKTVTSIKEQSGQLQSDLGRYTQVNQKIGELQRQLTEVQGQVVDLGNRTIRAGKIEAIGKPGVSSFFSFSSLGCQPSALEGGYKVALCAEDTPSGVFFFQRTLSGDPKPVSSVSPIGFQDVSNAPKPPCIAPNRGTFYVEKGAGAVSDKAFLCVRNASNSFG